MYGIYRPDETTVFANEELPLVRALRHNESFRNVGMYLRKTESRDGLHLSATVTPLVDESGTTQGAVMVYRDTTEIVRAERELKESNARLRKQTATMEAVLNSIGDGILVVRADGDIEMVNPSAERIAGISAMELDPAKQTGNYGSFFADGVTHVPYDELPLVRAMRGESTDDTEIFVRNPKVPDGVYVSVNARPVVDPLGNLLGGVSAFRDVTDRRHLEDALMQAFSQGRIEILDTVLHNIGNAINSVTTGLSTVHDQLENNTPLRRFLALAEALEAHQDDLAGYLADDPQGRKAVPFAIALAEDFQRQSELLLKAVTRAVRSANHIVDVIRTQEPRRDRRLVRKDINLRRAIYESLGVLKESLVKRNIVASVRLDEAPDEIRVQESRFHEMLVNLVKNAMEAIDELAESASGAHRGRIDIHAYRREGFLVLEVTDNGIGIDADRIKLVFAPGYSTKANGHGLGLHSTANFVVGSGGTIEPISDGKGKGTTMRIRLRTVS